MKWEVVGGVGFKKTYTDAEWQEIERQRAEMRHRLTVEEGCTCDVCETFRKKLTPKDG